MPKAGASAPGEGETSTGAGTEAIHERSRELVRRLLREGYIDADVVKNLVQTVTGDMVSQTASKPEEAHQIRRLSTALAASAESAHRALELVAERSGEATENDIKGALASLAKLQADCTSASGALADLGRGNLGRGNLRQEVGQLAAHAQNVGAEASARLAAMMNEFATGVGGLYRETATPGLQTARDLSARMALMTSGVFAGIADALSERRRPERPE